VDTDKMNYSQSKKLQHTEEFHNQFCQQLNCWTGRVRSLYFKGNSHYVYQSPVAPNIIRCNRKWNI